MTYSKEELLRCIFETMSESLPQDWLTAYMQISINNNEIDTNFKYLAAASSEELKFKPINFIAPLNAANELHKIMKSEGKVWKSATIKIDNKGNLNFFINPV